MQTSERVDMLGYKISPHRRWLRNDNGYRFQRNLKRMAQCYTQRILHKKDINAVVNSWIGHAVHGETYALRGVIFNAQVFVKNRRVQ